MLFAKLALNLLHFNWISRIYFRFHINCHFKWGKHGCTGLQTKNQQQQRYCMKKGKYIIWYPELQIIIRQVKCVEGYIDSVAGKSAKEDCCLP